MAHEIRTSITMTRRLDSLDVGQIAAADVTTKLIIADLNKVAAEHGLAVEVDGPKIINARTKAAAPVPPEPERSPNEHLQQAPIDEIDTDTGIPKRLLRNKDGSWKYPEMHAANGGQEAEPRADSLART